MRTMLIAGLVFCLVVLLVLAIICGIRIEKWLRN